MHLGLGHVRRLLAALDDPQLAFPTVLVAGTNGKGSTAALLAAMASAAGRRTGLYTSPHLEQVEERVRIAGRPVEGSTLGTAIIRVLAVADELRDRGELDSPPTYFEAMTAAACLVFRDAAVDLAVLEVGVGGRLDATNTADPVMSVITPVSLDHRELLGDTLAAVAGEKAGVLRPGRPAVAWAADREVRDALAAAAASQGAGLSFANEEVTLHVVATRPPAPWSGLRVTLATPLRSYDLETPLAGDHQAENLALAVRAAERLGEAGIELSPEAIAAGAAAVHWPGRLESVELPATGDRPALRILLDAAHNPAGAATLAAFLDQAASAGAPILVFGALADKDVAGMLPPLARRAHRIVLTRPPNDRGLDPTDLVGLVGLVSESTPIIEPDPERALTLALEMAAADPRPIVVCGSIFLLGAARGWLRRARP